MCEHRLWNVALQDFAQKPAPAPPAYAHLQWQSPGEFEQTMIEQRFAGFQADAHAGTIDLDQYIVRQVRQCVEIHHPLGERANTALDRDTGRLRGWSEVPRYETFGGM